MTPTPNQESPLVVEAPPGQSKVRRVGAIAGWSLFFLASLVFFTIAKFPDARLKAFVQDSINSALAPQGISLIAQSSSLSVLFGVKYTMDDVSIYFRQQDKTVKIERLKVSPSLLAIVTGKMAGTARIRQGDGEADVSFSLAGNTGSVSFDFDDLNLGKMGILPAVAGIKGGAEVEGYGEFSGNFSSPNTLSGEVELKLRKIKLEEQRAGFVPLPEIAISDAEIELKVRNGKADIKQFRLGKDSKDDVRGSLKGSLDLGSQLMASQLKASATFYLSDKVKKSFSLIDALIGQAKQSDGGYSVDLSGPLYMPNMVPAQGKH